MCFQQVGFPNRSFKHTKQEVNEPQLWSYVLKEHVREEFWGVSSPLCVEKANAEVNISQDTTSVVVWIYDGI